MSYKTIPFSVRLTQDDAEFIACLEMPDTATPSDKIRAIIGKANRDAQKKRDYAGVFEEMQNMLMPTIGLLRKKEMSQGEYSELLANFAEWLMEVNAFFIAMPQEESGTLDIHMLEEGVARRIFVLFERMMRMGVTETAPCYNKNLIKEKVVPLLELMDIIKQKAQTKA